MRPSLVVDDDGRARCGWVGDDAEYRRYHDEEWGHALHGDRELFEKLSLEGFQAGLSWITILRRRPTFLAALGSLMRTATRSCTLSPFGENATGAFTRKPLGGAAAALAGTVPDSVAETTAGTARTVRRRRSTENPHDRAPVPRAPAENRDAAERREVAPPGRPILPHVLRARDRARHLTARGAPRRGWSSTAGCS